MSEEPTVKETAPKEDSSENKSAKDTKAGKTPWVTTAIQRFFSPSAGVLVLAIVVALVLSALLVAFFDEDVQRAGQNLFSRPGDFFMAFGSSFSTFFVSLFRGAIYNFTAPTNAMAIKALTETLTRAVPLIIAGLAIAVSFKAGLFNIGVQGQLIMGAIGAAFVAINYPMPTILHIPLCIIAAIIGGMIWGAIPGFLKSYVGANEVIVTIMLNSVAAFFIAFTLKQPIMLHETGVPGKSEHIADSAIFPRLLGPQFNLHLGFIIAILAAILVWWILERSTFGFELRAAGANPQAAETAGINVKRVIVLTMVLSGALAGLAGTAPVMGTEKLLTGGAAGTYGFDAITVALLGKNNPFGVVAAGILFGALAAGSSTMQGAGISADIVQVTQAVIVLLISASEAIRYYREKKAVAQRAAASVKKEVADK